MEERKVEVKVWDKTAIVSLVTTNDKAAVKALLTIYSYQTQSEQAVDATTDQNGVGFTGVDAEILSSFAKFYQRTGFLTNKQMELLKRRITKYTRQLLKVIESKGGLVDYGSKPKCQSK